MSILVSFIATAVIALGLVVAGVPDRWLYPICLVAFVVLAFVLHGEKAHA